MEGFDMPPLMPSEPELPPQVFMPAPMGAPLSEEEMGKVLYEVVVEKHAFACCILIQTHIDVLL